MFHLACAVCIANYTDTHKKKVQTTNIDIRQLSCLIYSKVCTDTDSADHETNMTNNVVGKDLPVIFTDYRVDNTVDRHGCTKPGQQFPARENPQEHIDS